MFRIPALLSALLLVLATVPLARGETMLLRRESMNIDDENPSRHLKGKKDQDTSKSPMKKKDSGMGSKGMGRRELSEGQGRKLGSQPPMSMMEGGDRRLKGKKDKKDTSKSPMKKKDSGMGSKGMGRRELSEGQGRKLVSEDDEGHRHLKGKKDQDTSKSPMKKKDSGMGSKGMRR